MVQSTHDVVVGDVEVTKRYGARARGGEADREWRVLTLLHERAPGLAPVPLRREEVDGDPVVVMSRLPGSPLGDAPLVPAQVAGLAAALLTLHAVPVPDDLPVRRMGPADWVTHVRGWIAEDLPPVPGVVADAVASARAWLASPAVDAVTGPLPERVVGLADGNIGNVLWDGTRCRLVDFEDAGVTDPAYEVADLLEHVSVWLPGLVEPAALLDALGYDDVRRARVRQHRCAFAVFWLLMLLPGRPAHPRNPPGSLERQAERVLRLLG